MKTMFSPKEISVMRQRVAKDKQFNDFLVGLFQLHADFLKGISKLDDIVNKKVGPKGEKGDEGKPGKSPDIDEIVDRVYGMIRTPVDGRPGKDAENPDIDKIAEKVYAKIKTPSDGKTPVKGIHYFTPSDKEEIIKLVTAHVKLSTKEVELDPTKILDAISKLPAGKKIPSRLVDGMEQTLSALKNQTNRGYRHGGGDTVQAGTGIVITATNTGNKIISTSAAGAFLPATGTINDSNTVFGFTVKPSLININGPFYQQTGGSITWTWNTGTLQATLSSAVGINGSIWGLR